MAGHSKWKQIKRQKGVADVRRGQIFTKIGREIQQAVRRGGPSPTENPALRLAIAKARQTNMPKDNIDRAIQRAAESGRGENLDEIRYEAYGPGGVAILIDALTDNRNRTVSDVRAILGKAGGSMGNAGSVAWIFEQKGSISIDRTPEMDAEAIALEALDAGADDVVIDAGLIEVLTAAAAAEVERVRDRLEAQGITVAAAEVEMRPTTTVPVDSERAHSLLRLLGTLEELDDVQRVFTNADIPEAAFAQV